jgi:hypothetical protein
MRKLPASDRHRRVPATQASITQRHSRLRTLCCQLCRSTAQSAQQLAAGTPAPQAAALSTLPHAPGGAGLCSPWAATAAGKQHTHRRSCLVSLPSKCQSTLHPCVCCWRARPCTLVIHVLHILTASCFGL